MVHGCIHMPGLTPDARQLFERAGAALRSVEPAVFKAKRTFSTSTVWPAPRVLVKITLGARPRQFIAFRAL
jgi:hypothetical protein